VSRKLRGRSIDTLMLDELIIKELRKQTEPIKSKEIRRPAFVSQGLAYGSQLTTETISTRPVPLPSVLFRKSTCAHDYPQTTINLNSDF